MAELVNGYITVRTGLVEAAPAPVQRVPRSRQPTDSELRQRVTRLRRDGWSYRRIAATLEVRYTIIAEILDGPTIWVGDYRDTPSAAETLPAVVAGPVEPGRAVPAPRRAAPVRVVAATDDAIEAVLVQHARLSDKVDALLRSAEQQRTALTRLETSILGTIRTENARLIDRVTAGVKGLLERLLPLGPRRDDMRAGD
jgi:hypothetical protein